MTLHLSNYKKINKHQRPLDKMISKGDQGLKTDTTYNFEKARKINHNL